MANGMITHITVHCSATKANQNFTAKDIDKWHKQRGFARIGYHFVITRSGEVQKGRSEDDIGAHVMGHNKGNLGVCLIGGVDDKGNPQDNFTLEQKAELAKLLLELLKRHPRAEILGHRDWPGVRKACPSFDVKKWWGETVAAPEMGE